MILKQLYYFQSIVREQSFSRAAVLCNISQSAISQQIKVLEHQLGFELFIRKNRSFVLTEAGEYFYKKSLIISEDFQRLCEQSLNIAKKTEDSLKIGYLRDFSGKHFQNAIAQFSIQYPKVNLTIESDNHEGLYIKLKNGLLDIILNDQRRAFSDEYYNLILKTIPLHIEVAAKSNLAAFDEIDIEDLKNTPCVLISSEDQLATEQEFYKDILGFKGEFLVADNIEQARLLVLSNRAILPLDALEENNIQSSLKKIKLLRKGKQILRNYCAFSKLDNQNAYTKLFEQILLEQFKD